MTLYELTAEYKDIHELFWADDVDPEVVEGTLEAIKGQLEVKAEGYVQLIRQFEAEAIMFNQEAERFAKKQKVAENAAKRMKQAIQQAMTELQIPDIDTGLHKLKLVNNGGKRPLWVTEDIDKIPEDYIRIKKEADKTKISEYLSGLPEDVELPWAKLQERGQHLTIK